MDAERWRDVDAYFVERLNLADEALDGALERSAQAGLPEIAVSAPHGALLEILVRSTGSRRILEIGTLGGYSALRLARGAGDDGHVITIEAEDTHAAIARKNIEAAGMTSRVTVVVGRALTVLDSMIEEVVEPFDFVFIDADKESNVDYLDRAVMLGKAGSMLYVDNVVRDGAVLDDTSDRGDVVGTRALFDALHSHPRLTSTAVQTVGNKGYDGFVVALMTR